MISKKGKRKLKYEGQIFYWFVKADEAGALRIHILSEEKRIRLAVPLFDSEIPVTPFYIQQLLKVYFAGL